MTPYYASLNRVDYEQAIGMHPKALNHSQHATPVRFIEVEASDVEAPKGSGGAVSRILSSPPRRGRRPFV